MANKIKNLLLIAAIAVAGCGGMSSGNIDGVSETQSAVCSPPSAITGTAYMDGDVWSDTVASPSCPNCGSCDIWAYQALHLTNRFIHVTNGDTDTTTETTTGSNPQTGGMLETTFVIDFSGHTSSCLYQYQGHFDAPFHGQNPAALCTWSADGVLLNVQGNGP